MKKVGNWQQKLAAILAFAIVAWTGAGLDGVCRAQTAPADLSPDVQEVLTLSRQHMDDSVITNYIRSTGKSYKLSADDIIYLNSQGVSQGVIAALLQSAANGGGQNAAPASTAPAPATPAPAAPTPAAPVSSPVPTNVVSSAEPPPLDPNSNVPQPPAPATPPAPASTSSAPAPMPAVSMPMIPAPLQDNFYTDSGLNGSLWQTQTPLLSSLGAANGRLVSPVLVFSPSGLQISGIRGKHQFTGIQSAFQYSPPFTFSVTVAGMAQDAVPFEVYLVSQDLTQWLSVAGHLGGRGRPRGDVHIGLFGPFGGARFNVPTGGPSPDFGVWVNHTGSGLPISALGNMLYNYPIAGVPYTIQVSAGSDGMATVTLLDASHMVLGVQSVPVGTGPFNIVLAGRDGETYAIWQTIQLTPAAPPTPVAQPAPAAPETTPTLAYFQDQLSPYGAWVDLPGYGTVWQPNVAPGWRPYYDGGHWEYTDAGWYWQSDYPWGDIAFHYGRWAYTSAGWVWVPGYDYAPAWVVWRHDDADGYIGWAPLPPGAVFVDGGWVFHGAHVGADFDFGLGPNYFTFIGYDHFWEHDYRHWFVPHDRIVFFYHHSAIENHYRFDHGVFVNVGMGHDRMVVFTHHDFHPMAVHDMRHDEEWHDNWQRQNDFHNDHGGSPGGQQWNHGGQPGNQGGWHH